VDVNAEILQLARSRIQAVGWTTVTFHPGDIMELDLDRDFDAVAGRWVLQYTPDPVALLRRARNWLRPGGSSPSRRSTSAAHPGAIRPGRCTSRWCAGPRRRLAPSDPILRWG
jgi:ubiquinone/menaquinone biosynthesis C-methylase UbiE